MDEAEAPLDHPPAISEFFSLLWKRRKVYLSEAKVDDGLASFEGDFAFLASKLPDELAAVSRKHRRAVLEQSRATPAFTLPDSVLIHHGRPVSWFFSSRSDVCSFASSSMPGSSGEILRKLSRNCSTKAILKTFSTPLPRRRQGVRGMSKRTLASTANSEIVACFYRVSEEVVENHHGQKMLPAEYLTSKELEAFLRSASSNFLTGILQRFVNPMGGQACVYRVTWGRGVAVTERRLSKIHVCDTHHSPFERSTVFEHVPEHLTSAALVGPKTRDLLRDLVGEIVSHINGLAREKWEVKTIQLNFSIAEDERLYLLWPSRLALQQRDGKEVMPHVLGLMTETQRLEPQLIARQPVPTCQCCGESVGGMLSSGSASLCPVTFAMMLRVFDVFRRHPNLPATIGGQEKLAKLLRADADTPFLPPPLFTTLSTETDDDDFTSKKCQEAVMKMRANVIWQKKTVACCDSCFLTLTDAVNILIPRIPYSEPSRPPPPRRRPVSAMPRLVSPEQAPKAASPQGCGGWDQSPPPMRPQSASAHQERKTVTRPKSAAAARTPLLERLARQPAPPDRKRRPRTAVHEDDDVQQLRPHEPIIVQKTSKFFFL